VTCLVPQVSSDWNSKVDIPMMLTAQPGTADGTQAAIGLSATSVEANPFTTSNWPPSVTVMNRPNLVQSPQGGQPLLELARRQSGTMRPITVSNTGTQPAEGVTVTFSTGNYLPMSADFGNCLISADHANVVCFIADVIQPGETYQLTGAPSFRMTNDTPYTVPGTLVGGYAEQVAPGYAVANDTSWGSFTAGTGAPLTMVRTVGTGTPQTTTQQVQQSNYPNTVDDYWQPIRSTDGLTTDLVARGGHFEAVGTTPATVQVGVRNAGGATLDNLAGTGVAHVTFNVPAGATVTSAPDRCTPVVTDGSWPQAGAPGYAVYDCYNYDNLAAHSSMQWQFQLTLAAGVPKATGSAVVHFVGDSGPGPFPAGWDTDPSNDTAAVVVTAGD
jgi:hypothetical protein